jgi:hypothetical protein
MYLLCVESVKNCSWQVGCDYGIDGAVASTGPVTQTLSKPRW